MRTMGVGGLGWVDLDWDAFIQLSLSRNISFHTN